MRFWPTRSRSSHNQRASGRCLLRAKSPSGLTLLELLVVLAIIGILAALLLSVLAQTKRKAARIQCVANLHELGVGLQTFVAENHAYPSFIGPTNSDNQGLWISQLARGGFDLERPPTNLVREGVWHCPTAPVWQPLRTGGSNHELFCSYGYNVSGVMWPLDDTQALGLRGRITPGATFVPNFPGFAPVNESEVTVPAEMIAIGDSLVGGITFDRLPLDIVEGMNADKRHQSCLNVAFCDGHVETATLPSLFTYTDDTSLSRWNRDHQPHRDKLPP
jgi:prepilin-type N-terminal cleavage/methylation domain-containing protein/prepilin-type processing-associated H-X9-DG protein